MLDTIALYLNKSLSSSEDLISDIEPLLTNITARYKTKTGINVIKGDYGNFKVVLRDTGIHISGSLPKFYFGNNLQYLNIDQTKEAFQLLSDSLNLPLDNAQVTRIDYGINLEMENAPTKYYPFLGKSSWYNRSEIGTGLYYSTKKGQKKSAARTNVIYDKLEELRAKAQEIPSDYNQKNILRYEIRFLRDVTAKVGKKVFGRAVEGKDLYNPELLNWLNDQWLESYQKIQKIDYIYCGEEEASTSKAFVNSLARTGINALGGVEEVLDSVEAAYQNNVFGEGDYGRQNKYRIVKKVEALCAAPDNTRVSPLLAELDEVFVKSHAKIQKEITPKPEPVKA